MKRQMKTMDGNHAAAYASYAYTDVAAIYPITPSSPMAEVTDEWANAGRKNIFKQIVNITEMQSEGGAAGTVHGSLVAGAFATTYTASQGLLLMIPNLYKIAAEGLPGVFDVAARSVATHALSIFGDHSDVYACRQTGVAMLCEDSVQEIMDLTPVAHLSAVKGRTPFINFFDGFRTSHEIQKIGVWDYEDLKDLADFDEIIKFRQSALNPNNPRSMGSAQNGDIFFQTRETCNTRYNELPKVVQSYMDKINEKIGTDYKLFNYYGASDATHIIVAMGSVNETIEETVDYLIEKHNAKVGLIKVRLYRPFCKDAFIKEIPDTVKEISVLDRTKEPGSGGEPLYLDVVNAVRNTKFVNAKIYGGRYGLSSKDTKPKDIIAVYDNHEKYEFTIGIIDDVTNLSLTPKSNPITIKDDIISCKFWGFGSDGTVGANKNSIKIIGDNTDMSVQAYFDYDSKKSGGVTISHLRFGHSKIKASYLIDRANFVACHAPAYLYKYDMVEDLIPGGTFLLNCPWSLEDLEKRLPNKVKKYIAENNINFYIINGLKIGKEIGLGFRINTVLQSAFFALTNLIPREKVIKLMKDAATKTYSRKGDNIVKMNHLAIERGASSYIKVDVPSEWKNYEDVELEFNIKDTNNKKALSFVKNIQLKVNRQKGNSIPVSALMKYTYGDTPAGTSAFEKRGVASEVPMWIAETCIQCNRCSFVCPHAAIRPTVMTEEEYKNAPNGMKAKDMVGAKGYKFSIDISTLDCTGCNACVEACPVKALIMKPIDEVRDNQKYFDYANTLKEKPEIIDKFKIDSVKGSQFKKPLLEFSGACAGCGETPYAKLLTQMFGDKMYIANSTGCSSIWGNSSPSTPYTVNECGKGPAWSNSLFEDTAEFGFGMLLAQKTIRKRLFDELTELSNKTSHEEIKEAVTGWKDTFNEGAENSVRTDILVSTLEKFNEGENILKEKDFLSKKSQWVFGGDGWAYDIGFGGLDHVIASDQDINIIVFDTEMYSNTGGQASKSTPMGAMAKFAAGGKKTKKKDLAAIAMSYGHVYVAQVAMGADMNQCIRAFKEAEAYEGPSLIIAYAPCISHGIKKGMAEGMNEEKLAIETGYWFNFRYNPFDKRTKKPMFKLDSREPKKSYEEFLEGENRYTALQKMDKDKAKKLFEEASKEAKEKYDHLLKLESMYKEK